MQGKLKLADVPKSKGVQGNAQCLFIGDFVLSGSEFPMHRNARAQHRMDKPVVGTIHVAIVAN